MLPEVVEWVAILLESLYIFPQRLCPCFRLALVALQTMHHRTKRLRAAIYESLFRCTGATKKNVETKEGKHALKETVRGVPAPRCGAT